LIDDRLSGGRVETHLRYPTTSPSLRFVVLALLLPLLTACAGRPGPDVLSPVAADVPGARRVTIYVATSRARSTTESPLFTDGRSPTLNFARYVISIPPTHVTSAIEWPTGGRPDPATSFVTVEETALDAASFRRQVAATVPRPSASPRAVPAKASVPAIAAATAARLPGEAGVGVFVHGYNYSFQEALFRAAQMAADSHLEGAPVLFAWPSAGQISGYVADKEAVTFSRDHLARLLTLLGQTPGTGRIDVLAHSMGSWLTMEALRQMRLTGQNAAIARLGQVTLAAPDIDVDVFASQVRTLGPLDPPLTLLVAGDDKALSLSSFLSGERERLGRIDVADPRVAAAAAQYHLRVIDISTLQAQDSSNHNRFVAMAALYPQLAAGPRVGNGVSNAGAFVFDAVGATLSSPFRLASGALGGR
jgi:esterase/lipase superfamily enzyme